MKIPLILAATHPLLLVISKFRVVRIHSALVQATGSYLKLWYWCRVKDHRGSGRISINLLQACEVFGRSPSRMRQWLQEGRAAGAFRSYKERRGLVRIFLGSLFNLTKNLGLDCWGDVSEIPAIALPDLRLHSTATAAQCSQNRSRYASRRFLKTQERKIFKPLDPLELLNPAVSTSPKLHRGVKCGVLAASAKRIFVDHTFVPLGASQQGIADQLSRDIRTVQRHLDELQISRKQICQTKRAYAQASAAIRYKTDYVGEDVQVYVNPHWDSACLQEKNGRSVREREGGFICSSGRFFFWEGRHWLYRCNLYDLDYSIKSMAYARSKFKRWLIHKSCLSPLPSRSVTSRGLGEIKKSYESVPSRG